MKLMSFKDLNIKIKYDSDNDDILNDFYIPVLSNAKKYYRLAGFFDSSTLASAASGMENFIKNNGKMELICNVKLNKHDFEQIEKAERNPEEIIAEKFIDDLNSITDNFILNHIKALGWMLVHKNLEIKIAFPKNQIGIFHPKIGVLIDNEDNELSFSGSENETTSGWQNNIEEFKVFCSWKNGHEDFIESDRESFFKYWEDLALRTKTISIPEIIKEKLIKIAPDNLTELNFTSYKNMKKDTINLRDYQKEAILSWFENDKKGIFNMATGTGKTYTALGCLKKLIEKKKDDNFLTIIVCPQKHLINQWKDQLPHFIKSETLLAYSDNNSWKSDLEDIFIDYDFGILEYPIVLTTHNTFSSPKFIKMMNSFEGETFLIVDEVHGVGSNKFRYGLLEKYDYRLGLSATPERWYDEEGTEIINNYFNGCVYSFSMKKALKEGFLTHYNYYPKFVELNEDELEEYFYYTTLIATLLSKNKKTDRDNKNIDSYSLKRQKIVNNADSKYNSLKKFLDEHIKIKNLIVYCSPEQIVKVEKILKSKDLFISKFTGEEKTNPSEEYGGISQREYILNNFANGEYDALVAMKCLDEGVDIPSAENAVLMSSTSNPREYVQRRGRILRKSPGKKIANIYDYIVSPDLEKCSELEKKILTKELKRYNEFAMLANNCDKCSEIIIDKLSD